MSNTVNNMAAASKSDAPQLSKWQLALLIGVGTPVAFGIAYWYFKKKKDCRKSDLQCEDIYDNSSSDSHQPLIKKQFNSLKKEQKIPETPYEKAKASKDKGNKFFKEGQFHKAIECYTAAIELCPLDEHSEDLATFYQNRAAAHENLKNFEAVINDTTKALEHNKSYLKALYRRAKAYESTGQLYKCLDDLTALCMFDAFRTEAYLKLTDKVLKDLSKIEAKETFSKRNPRLPSKHFIRHYFISFSEDPIINSEEYTKFKEESDTPELSGYRLVIYNLAKENFDDVIPSCNVEIERNGPNMAEALLVRGTFKLLQGQIDDSLEDLTKLLSYESVDIKVRVNCLIKVGSLKVQLEKMEEALEDFNKAIEMDPNNADIYLHRGQVYVLLDRVQECLKDMEKSCSLNPNFPSARAQKCYLQYRCGIQFNDEAQKAAALKGFEDIQKNFPLCSESYFLYAQVLIECQQFEKAEKYFKKAGELDPNDPNVFVHQGLLALQWKEDIEKALVCFNKAIEMDDKCQFGYETLGSLEIQRGNIKRGLELFQKAVDVAHTETELGHLYSLLLAAKAQAKTAESLGYNTG